MHIGAPKVDDLLSSNNQLIFSQQLILCTSAMLIVINILFCLVKIAWFFIWFYTRGVSEIPSYVIEEKKNQKQGKKEKPFEVWD